MNGKPAGMSRWAWVRRQLATAGFFLIGVNSTAGWARYLMGDELNLPWPVYPLGAALFLWTGVFRLIKDQTPFTGTRPTTDTEVERLCEVMHDAYEQAAIGAGWETQKASRKPWSDVPEANKATMRVAVRALLQSVGTR